jgi:hypothetical protein
MVLQNIEGVSMRKIFTFFISLIILATVFFLAGCDSFYSIPDEENETGNTDGSSSSESYYAAMLGSFNGSEASGSVGYWRLYENGDMTSYMTGMTQDSQFFTMTGMGSYSLNSGSLTAIINGQMKGDNFSVGFNLTITGTLTGNSASGSYTITFNDSSMGDDSGSWGTSVSYGTDSSTGYSSSYSYSSDSSSDYSSSTGASSSAEFSQLISLSSWYSDSLSTGEQVWYYFDAVSGQNYLIYWDDAVYGSSTYTADIKVSAYNEALDTVYFENMDYDYYSSPYTITASATERIYILVEGALPANSGTFAIKVSEPVINSPVNITFGTWTIGSINEAYEEYWFVFSATAGYSYDIYWDDISDGSAVYGCDVTVTAYYANQTTTYFENIDSGYNNPSTVYATTSENIYIKVLGNYGTSTGDFAVRVSDGYL